MTERTEYAFPLDNAFRTDNGMTLRDYFAGQVVSGNIRGGTAESIAQSAYIIADAMLEARK